MIACFDVGYADEGTAGENTIGKSVNAVAPAAVAACVTLDDWRSADSTDEVVIGIDNVQPYVPGQFYRRELPCILETLNHLSQQPDIVIVDSFVWLSPDGKKGLGAHLHEALGGNTIVVGVAKSYFRLATQAIPVLRGAGKHPLYVTAEGMAQDKAAISVEQMHGRHRLPTALKRVDQLSRTTLETN